MKRFCLALLTLLLAVSIFASATAEDGIVVNVGGFEKFTFGPGSAYSDSDLFPNFKDVMPGDTIEQTIKVTNKMDKKVRIWLNAEAVSPEDEDFLKQLYMTVDCKGSSIFDAECSETAQLTEKTSLGVFKKKGSVTLEVTLYVPIELGSEYMNTVGTIPWTFTVEEIPDSNPKTGDWFNVAVWISVAAVLTAGIVVVLLMIMKRRGAGEK